MLGFTIHTQVSCLLVFDFRFNRSWFLSPIMFDWLTAGRSGRSTIPVVGRPVRSTDVHKRARQLELVDRSTDQRALLSENGPGRPKKRKIFGNWFDLLHFYLEFSLEFFFVILIFKLFVFSHLSYLSILSIGSYFLWENWFVVESDRQVVNPP